MSLIWLSPRIGSAVLEECGARERNGVNNGSTEQMQCLAKELKDAGYRGYEIITLRKMRDTAFTADSRLSGVAFWVHEAAGKPDVLVRAQGQAKQERVKLTVAYVKGFKARERRERDARDREQNEKLKDRQRPDLKTHRGPWLQARR